MASEPNDTTQKFLQSVKSLAKTQALEYVNDNGINAIDQSDIKNALYKLAERMSGSELNTTKLNLLTVVTIFVDTYTATVLAIQKVIAE